MRFCTRLAACGDELPLVRGLRLAVARRFGRRAFCCLRGRAIAGAAMHYATHMAICSRSWVPRRGFRRHGGGGPLRVSTRGAADESLGFGDARMRPRLPAARAAVAGHSLHRSAISFLGFWFLANFLFGTIPCRLTPARRSLGRPISAAFSWLWRFAGSTRRPLPPARCDLKGS